MRRIRRFLMVLGILAVMGVLHFPLTPQLSSSLNPPAHALVGYRFTDLFYLRRVSFLVDQHYVDSQQIEPSKMLRKALKRMELRVPALMIRFAKNKKQFTVRVDKKEKTFRIRALSSATSVPYQLKSVFEFIRREYRGDIKFRDIEFAALHGMLSTLDPHTNFLPPSYYRDMQVGMDQEFGGLGIVIQNRKGFLTIMSPMPNTPASRVGVKPLDRIVRIGDESTINMTLTEAVTRLRGKPGTKVVIWIMRKGFSKPRPFTIIRAIIKVKSVTYATLPNKIGYVRIKNFQRKTANEVRRALKIMKRKMKTMSGLVLDLRDNPGGLLEQGIQIADTFLSKGVIVSHAGGSSRRKTRSATEFNTAADYPIIVLINRGSASASEIVAGALKNNGRALILGQRSYGKGTVQMLYPISARQRLFSRELSALKLTIAQYLTPGDVSIHKIGITPDIALHAVNIEKDQIRFIESGKAKAFDKKKLPKYLKGIREAGKPLYHLSFLDTTTLKQRKKRYERSYANNNNVVIDKTVRLAQRLLKSATKSKRMAMFQELKAALNKEKSKEQKRIFRALRKLKVDWSMPKKGTKVASLKISSRLLPPKKRKKGVRFNARRLKAGVNFRLQITVKNKSKFPAYRVRGLLKSRYWFLNRKEFIFGRIRAGRSKSWIVEVQLPKWLKSQKHVMKFAVQQEGQAKSQLAKVPLNIHGYKAPRFAFTYAIEELKGNGDQLIQPGEEIALRVTVRNIGKGIAPKVIGLLKNKTGRKLFIKAGRIRFGALKPNQTSTSWFRFRVRPATLNPELNMELTLFDAELLTTVREQIKVNLFRGTDKPTPVKGKYVKGKEQWSWLYDGSSFDSSRVGRLGKGKTLPVVAKMGPFWKVKLPRTFIRQLKFSKTGRTGKKKFSGPVFAWVAGRDVKVVAKRSRKRSGLQNYWQYKTPQIVVSVPKGPIAVQTATYKFKVSITNNCSLRDVYVLVNGAKVYFKALQKQPNLNFGLTVKLKKGRNRILVIARETTKFSGFREILIHRHVPGVRKVAGTRPTKK
jgi:carboxyl-terminal processing protease